FAEPDPDLGRTLAGGEHDPGLRLPERRAERLAGERAVRVRVDRQPLGRVEELHEERGRAAEARNVGVAEPAARIGRDGVSGKTPVGEAGEAPPDAVRARIARLGHRAEPVLREERILLRLATEAADERAAAVEATDTGRLERLGAHGRSLTPARAPGRASVSR